MPRRVVAPLLFLALVAAAASADPPRVADPRRLFGGGPSLFGAPGVEVVGGTPDARRFEPKPLVEAGGESAAAAAALDTTASGAAAGDGAAGDGAVGGAASGDAAAGDAAKTGVEDPVAGAGEVAAADGAQAHDPRQDIQAGGPGQAEAVIADEASIAPAVGGEPRGAGLEAAPADTGAGGASVAATPSVVTGEVSAAGNVTSGAGANAAEAAEKREVVTLSAGEKRLLGALNISVFSGGSEAVAMERGVMGKAFKACGAGSEGDCFRAGALVDRVKIVFRFDKNAVAREVLADYLGGLGGETFAPHAAVEGGRAVPEVAKVRLDRTTSSGSVVVKYHCAEPADDGIAKKEVASLITFSLPLSVTGAASEFTWSKTCGSGVLNDVSFGYLDHNRDIVPFHADGSHGDDQRVGMEVSPHSSATVLSLRLDSAVQSLDFLAPYVTSSQPEDVQFSVRGSRIDGTILTPGEPAEISIMYDCVAAVNSLFTATIGIPPWKNLTASWTKDCGGHLPKSLVIGSGSPTNYDVLQDGELTSSYDAAKFSTPSMARRQGVHVLDASTHSALFYLTNADQTSDIHLQSVTVTMDSNKMTAEVENPSMQPLLGAGYVTKKGAVIGRGSAKRLSLHFYCKGSGDVLVLVTLTTLLYQNVEFGFVKQCVEGRVYHRSALTAGSLLSAIFFACVATTVLACAYYVRKRRRESELSKLPFSSRKQARGKYSLVDDEDVPL